MSEKYFKELEGDIVCCMIEGLGLIVGKMKNKDSSPPTIKNPRVVQYKRPEKEGQKSEMRFAEMMGTPDELIMVRPPVFVFKIIKKDVKDLYTKSTTSLVLASGGLQ